MCYEIVEIVSDDVTVFNTEMGADKKHTVRICSLHTKDVKSGHEYDVAIGPEVAASLQELMKYRDSLVGVFIKVKVVEDTSPLWQIAGIMYTAVA